MLRLCGRLSRRGRHAARAGAVLGARELAQRDRLARDPVRPGLPGRRVDARHARRAQPGADAARASDRRDARGARHPGVLAAQPGCRRDDRQGRDRRRRRGPRPGADPARGRAGAGMNPTEIVRAILAAAPDALIVSSLGTATSALRAASDDGPHLYMGGSMGTALAVALGVAEKRPARRVVAVLGDGESVMGAGSLWSLAGIRPANLLAAVLVDGHYTITGDQLLGVPAVFGGVAAALGLNAAAAATYEEIGMQVRTLARPAVLEMHYDERTWPGPSPFVDPPVVRWRFEQAAS